MADVFDIAADLNATGRALGTFARQIEARDWTILSDRLLDVRDGLTAAELSLDAWQRKYNIRRERDTRYLEALFGLRGCKRIRATLENVASAAGLARDDTNGLITKAVGRRVKGKDNSFDRSFHYSNDEIDYSLKTIRRNPSRARRFFHSAIRRSDELSGHLEHLHRKLTLLERLSDRFLESQHPDDFQHIPSLSGRRVTRVRGYIHQHKMQNKLLDGLAARKDAELLHRAAQGNTIHIGLSVPQINKRDFAFLLSFDDGVQEVLMHPVKITAVNDPSRVHSTMPTAISSLLRDMHESCYMLPSVSSSAGFQVTIPPARILSALEFKYPLSTLIRGSGDSLTHQTLYSHDQSALACGLAHNAFRLIGSPWLHFLDCHNVRIRKNAAGQWTSMLAAVPGSPAITDALDDWVAARWDERSQQELARGTQVFRIGLVLAELALGEPVGNIVYDPISSAVAILVQGADNMAEVVEVEEIAAEVERKTNVFMGNLVGSCLSVLKDEQRDTEKGVEEVYYEEVLGQVEELEQMMREWKRGSPAESTVGTPRSSRSVRSAVLVD